MLGIRLKLFIDGFGILHVFEVSEKYSFLSGFLRGNSTSESIQSFINDFEELKLKSIDEIKEELIDWHPNLYNEPDIGVFIPVWGIFLISIYYTEDGQLKIKPDGSEPLNTSFDEIIDFLEKGKAIYQRFEQPESFSVYKNMLELVNKKYSKKLENLGFRCVGQTPDMVRFVKEWLLIDLLEDRDGAVLFFTDQRNGERYEFNMALELLDWDAGNMHGMLCQKYKLKLSKEEARTGTIEVTFQYLESHFMDILESLDEAFFAKLEEERQLRTQMLQKVLLLPKDNMIHRLFVDGSPVWWEYMRQEMAK